MGNTENRFEKIAEDAVRAAEKVPCSPEEFLDGLKYISDELHERWVMETAIQKDRG